MSHNEVATLPSLTDTEELLLMYLEESPTLTVAAEKTGISLGHASNLARKLKDVIQERTRDKLTLAGLKAAGTLVELMDADSSTQQGVLRHKVAADVLDRMGATKQSSIDVSIESTNGIFILPGKTPVPEEPVLEADYEEIPNDS